jgi:hypothetical protein
MNDELQRYDRKRAWRGPSNILHFFLEVLRKIKRIIDIPAEIRTEYLPEYKSTELPIQLPVPFLKVCGI